MKKIIPLVGCLLIITTLANGQSTPQTQASQIAQKLKDSLSLTSQQQTQIEAATLTVQNLRTNLKGLYKGRAQEYYLRMAEDNRDTLYKNILPSDKYLLFRQKKTTLITSY